MSAYTIVRVLKRVGTAITTLLLWRLVLRMDAEMKVDTRGQWAKINSKPVEDPYEKRELDGVPLERVMSDDAAGVERRKGSLRDGHRGARDTG